MGSAGAVRLKEKSFTPPTSNGGSRTKVRVKRLLWLFQEGKIGHS